MQNHCNDSKNDRISSNVRFFSSNRPTRYNSELTENGLVARNFKRRGGDSNPRWAFDPHAISNRARSATPSPLLDNSPNLCPETITICLAPLFNWEIMSGRRGSNSGPLAPHASALPDCATARKILSSLLYSYRTCLQAFFILLAIFKFISFSPMSQHFLYVAFAETNQMVASALFHIH